MHLFADESTDAATLTVGDSKEEPVRRTGDKQPA
jgi:hypothetical protein